MQMWLGKSMCHEKGMYVNLRKSACEDRGCVNVRKSVFEEGRCVNKQKDMTL